MALAGKPPPDKATRLKMMLYGAAGCGKTTAAIQLPNPYIVDSEKGTDRYGSLIRSVNGAVVQTSSYDAVIKEIKALATEKHPYKSLIIDPITPIYNDTLDKAEDELGASHGRHFGKAGKLFRRMYSLITNLDMNVCVICHGKAEYAPGKEMLKIGETFDGPKSWDHMFDLVLELTKKGNKSAVRKAFVKKTRIEAFPDGDIFDWSYKELMRRMGQDAIEGESRPIEYVSKDNLDRFRTLVRESRITAQEATEMQDQCGVTDWEDAPAEYIDRFIVQLQDRVNRLKLAKPEAIRLSTDSQVPEF